MRRLKNMVNNQKGFANIVLVVIIVVVASVGGYFVVRKSGLVVEQPTPTPTASQAKIPTPTPKDETANWKTYRNETYGFELKYPSYVTLKKEAIDTAPLIHGSRLEHYSFKFSPDPGNAFWGSFSIYDVNDFSVYSSTGEYGWVFYDPSTSKWYVSGEINIEERNPSRTKKKEYQPFTDSKTLGGVPIYSGFGYGDVGVSSSRRLIFVPNSSIIVDFLRGSDGNALDFRSKEVRELSQKFSNDLQTIIQSTKFTR